MIMLFKMTGWKIFRPRRSPWGESTSLWTEQDWIWYRGYHWNKPGTADQTGVPLAEE